MSQPSILDRLRKIANRAGQPISGYCPEADVKSQRQSLDWIAAEATTAILELTALNKTEETR